MKLILTYTYDAGDEHETIVIETYPFEFESIEHFWDYLKFRDKQAWEEHLKYRRSVIGKEYLPYHGDHPSGVMVFENLSVGMDWKESVKVYTLEEWFEKCKIN